MPSFPPSFQAQLGELLRLRRDVRRFRKDPVPEDVLLACLPSCGIPDLFVRWEESPAEDGADPLLTREEQGEDGFVPRHGAGTSDGFMEKRWSASVDDAVGVDSAA